MLITSHLTRIEGPSKHCTGMTTRVPSLIFAGKMAATLLLVVDDEADAFWLMVSIVEDMMPHGFYGANIDALMREVRRFDAHLSAAQPALAKHLRALGIDAPTLGFVHGWFSSVFCGFLPLEASLRVLDTLVCERTMDVVHRVAVTMLAQHSKALLASEETCTPPPLVSNATQFPSTCWRVPFGACGRKYGR